MKKKEKAQHGFTLTELVMVIVLLGIIGGVGGSFISEVFRGFADSDTRLQLYNEGKNALVRMERELHIMLPNAVCITSNGGLSCESDGTPGSEIRFGMILEDGMLSNNMVGRYNENPVDFPRTAPATLSDYNSGATPPAGGVVSLYNTNWNTFAGGSKLFTITGVSANIMTFAGQTITGPSPQKRYYLVDRCVSYRWDSAASTLSRRVTGVSNAGAGSFSGVTAYPMAKNVDDFRFYYAAPSLTRNGIVSVVFNMRKNGQNVEMHKEIHVKNVP